LVGKTYILVSEVTNGGGEKLSLTTAHRERNLGESLCSEDRPQLQRVQRKVSLEGKQRGSEFEGGRRKERRQREEKKIGHYWVSGGGKSSQEKFGARKKEIL